MAAPPGADTRGDFPSPDERLVGGPPYRGEAPALAGTGGLLERAARWAVRAEGKERPGRTWARVRGMDGVGVRARGKARGRRRWVAMGKGMREVKTWTGLAAVRWPQGQRV